MIMCLAGISVRFMNANMQGDNIRDSAAAANLVARCQFSGMTPLGTQMYERILKPLVEAPISNRTMQKPVLIITITDGEPTSEPESKIVKVIKHVKQFAAKSQYGSGAVAFEFAQVCTHYPRSTSLLTHSDPPPLSPPSSPSPFSPLNLPAPPLAMPLTVHRL